MGRVATLSLTEHLDDELLVQVARIMIGGRIGFLDGPDVDLEDADLEPFYDWDAVRGHGHGYFCGDAVECRSRRVDLRGPTDLDPGPLPMEEAPEDVNAPHLTF